jgi:predicted glycosyltransferase
VRVFIFFLQSGNYFVTDDCLTFIGRLKGVKSIFVTDDDLSAVPESAILMASAHYILAPDICELGKYNKKKWGYWGYKSIFHLHPNQFQPDITKIGELKNETYFFIRTVSATSTHDVGKRGISDDLLRKIITKLKPIGKIVLNSERQLPDDLQQYVLDFHKNDVSHYVAHCKLFISDSTTMCAEAAMLGIPAVEIDDWYSDFKQYFELNEKYNLLFGFGVDEENKIFNKIDEIINLKNSFDEFQIRRKKMLKEKIDASNFLIWMLTDYPNSVNSFFNNRSIQQKFITQ